jgi:hypothetical protein
MWSSTRSKTFPDSEIACIEKVRKKRKREEGEREKRERREKKKKNERQQSAVKLGPRVQE